MSTVLKENAVRLLLAQLSLACSLLIATWWDLVRHQHALLARQMFQMSHVCKANVPLTEHIWDNGHLFAEFSVLPAIARRATGRPEL